MADTAEDLARHKRTYCAVGIALIVFTCLAFALGKWPIFDFGPPGPSPSDFVFGLAVAGIKAGLVALIFMHLSRESSIIYKTLLFTFLFFIGLMSLILFTGADSVVKSFETLVTTQGKLLD